MTFTVVAIVILLVSSTGICYEEENESIQVSDLTFKDSLEYLSDYSPEILSREKRAVDNSSIDNKTESAASTTVLPNVTSTVASSVKVSSASAESSDSGSTEDATSSSPTTEGSTSSFTTTSTLPPTSTSTVPPTSTSTIPPTTTAFNVTVQKDNHRYYVSHIYNTPNTTAPVLADLKRKFVGVEPSHNFLKKTYGRVKLFKSSFKFPFYGHMVNSVAITTGGFLYVSNFLHLYLMHSQYIAPFMNRFHTINNISDIYHVDDGSSFSVLWKDVYIYKQEKAGPFTFYAQILKNGTIIFAYEKLPILPKDISGTTKKIGLSDAFYWDELLAFSLRIRRVFRYHVVTIPLDKIRLNTVVVIQPALTCHELLTCTDCLSGRTNFKCSWCPAAGRCSSGVDRTRQDWVEKACHLQKSSNSTCRKTTTNTTFHEVSSTSSPVELMKTTQKTGGLSVAGTMGVVFLLLTLIVCAAALVMWCRYAYTHPSSPSGIWLLEHRPSLIKERISRTFTGHGSGGERYEVSFNTQESIA